MSVTGLAVSAVAVDADHGVGEIGLIADDGDDGDGVFLVVLDITAGDGYAGQESFFEETEYVVGSLLDGKRAGTAFNARTTRFETVCPLFRSWQTTVGGIKECGSLRNLDLDIERIGEKFAADIDNWWSESVGGKDRGCVSGFWGGVGCPTPFVAAVSGTCIGCMTHSLRIGNAGDDVPALVAKKDSATVAVEFEGCLCIQDVVGTKPDDLVVLGGDFSDILRHLPFGQVVLVVAQVHFR